MQRPTSTTLIKLDAGSAADRTNAVAAGMGYIIGSPHRMLLELPGGRVTPRF